MSKSNLKPEDIFFSMQKTHEAKNRAFEEAKKQAEDAEVAKVLEEAKKQAETAEPEAAKEEPKPKAEKKAAAPTRKKRETASKADNEKRVQINVQMPVDVKYGAVTMVTEMKMRGLKERYSLTDFVNEAVEEKIKRTKKQLDIE